MFIALKSREILLCHLHNKLIYCYIYKEGQKVKQHAQKNLNITKRYEAGRQCGPVFSTVAS